MKIGFFVFQFPLISETFILNQIVGLLQRGYNVEIDADAFRSDQPTQHADVKRLHLIERTRYRERMPRPWTVRAKAGAIRILYWGWRRPLFVLDSLNVFRHGRRALDLSLLKIRCPQKLEQREFDVIHCHYGPNGQRAVTLRKLGEVKGPILTTFHGYDANSWPRIYGPNIYRELFEKGDLFTVGSEFMRNRLMTLGAPADKIVKLPMGVDLSQFQFRARRETVDGFRLLTVARLVEVKGIRYALNAVACVRARVPKLHYIIVGDGPLRGQLLAQARQLSLEDIVQFRGEMSREAVADEFAKAHAFVLPSIVTDSGEEENQPLVVAEAQACGIPVVATNIGGIAESLMPDITGYLVPPRDPDALASAIYRLSVDADMRTQMGQAGRAFVERNFNLDVLNDRLANIYRSLSHARALGASVPN
jgi:colanic acid/amylovoran/stewartan biosynthesis glycosyltransferase WcaL/AmsK/CpsK